MAGSPVPNDPNLTPEMRTFLDKTRRDLVAITAASLGAAVVSQTEAMSGIIALPANKDYRIVEKLPYGLTITGITTKTSSGTCTVTLKINSTAVTGAAIATTSTQQSATATAANVAVATDALVITISSNSSAVDLSFTITATRVFA